MGEADGPKRVDDGWVYEYKLWVGDLPSDISKMTIGQYCDGQMDTSVQSHRTRSGMAYAIITFTDETLAIKAFEQLSMAKAQHGKERMHWLVVEWFRGAR